MTKILCPECGRVLGDTDKSIDCNLNCHRCKKTQHCRVKIAKTTDYFKKYKEDKNVYN